MLRDKNVLFLCCVHFVGKYYNLVVIKTVYRKPISRPKASDWVTFSFSSNQTSFVTYFISLTCVYPNVKLQQIFHSIL